MIEEVEATSWRLRECIRVREVPARYRLGRMYRLRMLEEQKASKREVGFDRVETTAEMDADRLRTGFDSKPFYTKLYNPKWPHTPAEYTLEMTVDDERLNMEILLSQPAPPPQCDSSLRRLPEVDTGWDKPGTPHTDSQSTEREGIFPLQASLDSFLHVNTSLDHVGTNILLQPYIWVEDEEKTTTSEQAAAREDHRISGSRQG